VKQTTIEKMAELLAESQEPAGIHLNNYYERTNDVLTAYEAEKELLEKTQDWHDHGMVAPSCVGCPTAEYAIKTNKYTVVLTERLKEQYRIRVQNRQAPEGHIEHSFENWRAYLTGADQ
jgi:hypothetical protein